MKLIVLHHTATDKYTDKIGKEYHYVITTTGLIIHNRSVEDIVGSTWNIPVNNEAIQIALIGNFNNGNPEAIQIKQLQLLVTQIKQKYGNLEIKLHRDIGKSGCPGKYFDVVNYNLGEYKPRTQQIFSLSRYYSPMQGQTRYYGNKSYAADVTMNCGASAIGNDGCLYPANGVKLDNSKIGKVVACPSKYPLGTKFFLEGIGEVTCVDRGGAITTNRIDMWCGIGEDALNNWDSCPTGQRIGYVIK